MQPVLGGQPREVAEVAAKARWLLKSGVDNANPGFIVTNIDWNTYILMISKTFTLEMFQL